MQPACAACCFFSNTHSPPPLSIIHHHEHVCARDVVVQTALKTPQTSLTFFQVLWLPVWPTPRHANSQSTASCNQATLSSQPENSIPRTWLCEPWDIVLFVIYFSTLFTISHIRVDVVLKVNVKKFKQAKETLYGCIHVDGAYSSAQALRRPTPRDHHFRKSQRTLLEPQFIYQGLPDASYSSRRIHRMYHHTTTTYCEGKGRGRGRGSEPIAVAIYVKRPGGMRSSSEFCVHWLIDSAMDGYKVRVRDCPRLRGCFEIRGEMQRVIISTLLTKWWRFKAGCTAMKVKGDLRMELQLHLDT